MPKGGRRVAVDATSDREDVRPFNVLVRGDPKILLLTMGMIEFDGAAAAALIGRREAKEGELDKENDGLGLGGGETTIMPEFSDKAPTSLPPAPAPAPASAPAGSPPDEAGATPTAPAASPTALAAALALLLGLFVGSVVVFVAGMARARSRPE